MLKEHQAAIIRKENWNDYFLLCLESREIALQAQPGQFVMIKVNAHIYPLLRRPLSIHASGKNTFEVFFQIQGEGTRLLAAKQVGDSLDVLGPLGKGFTIGPHLKGKVVWLIGGGRGIAPLYFLARELRSRESRPIIFYGGRSLQDLPLREKFENADLAITCSTDDGSFGFEGFVSTLVEAELERHQPDCIFACGPEPMMEKVARIARSKSIPAQFSLESRMGCGFGACWGCVRKIRRGHTEPEWVKICEEGPVFSSDEIVWTEDDR